MIIRNSRSGSVPSNATLSQVTFTIPGRAVAILSGARLDGTLTNSVAIGGFSVNNTVSFPFDSNWNTQSFNSLFLFASRSTFIVEDVMTGSLTGGFTASGLSGTAIWVSSLVGEMVGNITGVFDGNFLLDYTGSGVSGVLTGNIGTLGITMSTYNYIAGGITGPGIDLATSFTTGAGVGHFGDYPDTQTSMSITFSSPGITRFEVVQWGQRYGHGMTAYDATGAIIHHFGPNSESVHPSIHGYGIDDTTKFYRFYGTSLDYTNGITSSYNPFLTSSGNEGTGTAPIRFIGFEDNPLSGSPTWIPENESGPSEFHYFDKFLITPWIGAEPTGTPPAAPTNNLIARYEPKNWGFSDGQVIDATHIFQNDTGDTTKDLTTIAGSPTFKTNLLVNSGGVAFPGVRFNGSTDSLTRGFAPVEHTIAVVVIPRGLAGSERFVCCYNIGPTSWAGGIPIETTPAWASYNYDGAVKLATAGTPVVDKPQLVVITATNSGFGKVRVDRTQTGSIAVGTLQNQTTFTLGDKANGGGVEAQVDIIALYLYSKELTGSDLTNLESYLYETYFDPKVLGANHLSGTFSGTLVGEFTGTFFGFATGTFTGTISGSIPGFTGSYSGSDGIGGTSSAFVTLSFVQTFGDPTVDMLDLLTGSHVSGNLFGGDAFTYNTRSIQFYDTSGTYILIPITGSTGVNVQAATGSGGGTPPPLTGQLFPRGIPTNR